MAAKSKRVASARTAKSRAAKKAVHSTPEVAPVVPDDSPALLEVGPAITMPGAPIMIPVAAPAVPPIGFEDRKKLLRELEKARKSKVLLYVTGDRPAWQTQISTEAVDMFSDHLDAIGVAKKISLVLYTNGGNTLAAWNIINLLRLFCDDLEIILPSKSLSAGTLMSLGANRIVMTKQATLGPIDPSIMGPLNPIIPGAPNAARAPVSVEAIRGYLDWACKELDIREGQNLTQIFTFLSQQVHPLVLGQIYRSRTQIQYLARRLLAHQVSDQEKVNSIIAFLCSDSGSHDYTINRREARDLGLKVEVPSEDLYGLIRKIHLSFRAELQLAEPYDPASLIGQDVQAPYHFRRCLIESIPGGSHAFISEGTLTKVMAPGQGGIVQSQITDTRTFEGWKKLA